MSGLSMASTAIVGRSNSLRENLFLLIRKWGCEEGVSVRSRCFLCQFDGIHQAPYHIKLKKEDMVFPYSFLDLWLQILPIIRARTEEIFVEKNKSNKIWILSTKAWAL